MTKNIKICNVQCVTQRIFDCNFESGKVIPKDSLKQHTVNKGANWANSNWQGQGSVARNIKDGALLIDERKRERDRTYI